ncbi:MAG TPA: SGNH/GDSL hydrolase family protein [Ktedonobacterales bacterium]
MEFSTTRAVTSAHTTQPQHTQRRLLRGWIGMVLGLTGVVALIVAFFAPAQAAQAQSAVRVKAYYLALGDSLAFGLQPNGDFNHGYAQQWFTMLREEGTRSLTDYGCPGETTDEFIGRASCDVVHNPYPSGESQLQAAVSFIAAHPHKVSPVSLDIGANDLVNFLKTQGAITPGGPGGCTVNGNVQGVLSHLDANLKDVILPDLVAALTGPGGQRTGDVVLMNLYDPYQNIFPCTVPFVQEYNAFLAADAAQFHMRVVDTFTAFGGAATPNPLICTYTWMCTSFADIHATTTGYGVIAAGFNRFVDSD